MMKVLHCITGLTGDGAQRMLLRLAESMQEFGVESSVVNLGEEHGVMSDLLRGLGVRVWSLNRHPTVWGALSGVKKLRGVIAQLNPDIVQGWMYHANVTALCAKSGGGANVPTICNIRRGLDDYAERKLKTRLVIQSNALLSRRADGFVYCSLASKVQHEEAGFLCNRTVVIENGFDTNRFKPNPEFRSAIRSEYGIGDEEIVIGNIARFDVAKGHAFLIEAFCTVVANHTPGRLVLIGRGVDQANDSLRALLSQFNCADRVLLLGERDRVENLIPAFDIYCSSSISEGFPNALSEAMACGIVCVATDTGASKQIVGGIGKVVPPRDSEALAEALLEVIKDGEVGRSRSGVLGRERIVNHFGLQSVAQSYVNLYRETLRAKETSQEAQGQKLVESLR